MRRTLKIICRGLPSVAVHMHDGLWSCARCGERVKVAW